MYYKIIRNDIAASKLVTLTTTVFVAAAAMLVSLAAILIVNLPGAIDTLMTQAKTPHFMQMHSGDVNTDRLADFARENGNVDQFQVREFLNVESSRILFNGNSLAGSVQDNGLSTQSEAFDYLLGLDGKVIQVSDGEIYVPLAYMKDGTAKIGDKAEIAGQAFTVAGFLRDSQMNSLLASSKRFLVSHQDYAELAHSGSIEYLIEFRLKDLSGLNAFEAEYAAAGLEANGPALTYPLFKMLNAISDGLTAGILLLISVLVVAIAFMCIRFTLLAKIEDDYREIGVMKALGLRVADIKKMYLAKYTAIAAAGCAAGYILSLVFKGMLLENIRLYMGVSSNSSIALPVGIAGVLLVFLAIVAYVNIVLNRFRDISAVEAIRFGTSQQDSSAGTKRFRLSRSRLLNTNIFLGIKDVLARKKLYLTMLAVLVIAAFIIIVPQNLYHTISAPGFSTYLGIGQSDLRLDIQQTDDIAGKTAEIAKAMHSDSAISKYTVLTTKTFRARTPDGLEERLKIELGDHTVFPVHYSQGTAPVLGNELALSALNADELGLQVGDDLTLMLLDKETPATFTVSGIYSDVTNGGKTAKAAFTGGSADIMWSVIYTELADSSLAAAKAAEYGERFAFAKVSDIEEYIAQTFGSTMSSVHRTSQAGLVVALLITVLVTLLFMNMLAVKDRYSIAVLKTCGFTGPDITLQYVARAVFVLVLGIAAGTLLANTLGESLAGLVISRLGAASFEFAVRPLAVYVLVPLMMAGAVLIATLLGTAGAGRIQIAEQLKE
ncbi:ABC transporter permease [Paenibacillus tepidiphilus]|uniref:ABC transporter permease n=1 Tax=Paenibacillus tepidiphilus TaxID=2608683 RepID=UPI00123A5E4E|nr:FtsX-like permease family protein [Paenibacillus tepidiphilus]